MLAAERSGLVERGMREHSSRVLLVPKNRGLAAQARRALVGLEATGTVQTLRGEDIPYVACELARAGQRFAAITGDDLLDDWLAAGNALHERIIRSRMAWCDPGALYGRPALCLIGRPGTELSPSSAIRIGICTRYVNLTRRYIGTLEAQGTTVEVVPLRGTLEILINCGLVDFMIDVVLSGGTMREHGLHVHEVIYESDLAILEAL